MNRRSAGGSGVRVQAGWQRRRETRRRVRLIDALARGVIQVGGIGTIAAVSTVGLFLLWVVLPLFRPASVGPRGALPPPARAASPLHLALDDEHVLGLALGAEGRVEAFDLQDGKPVASIPLTAGDSLTAAAFPPAGTEGCFGFRDGTVRWGRVGVVASFPPPGRLPPELAALPPGQRVDFDGGVLEAAEGGELRLHRLEVELEDPLDPPCTGAVVRLDGSTRPAGRTTAALTSDGVLHVFTQRSRRNLLAGRTDWTTRAAAFPIAAAPARGLPAYLLVSGQGESVYLAWPDGQLQRLDASDPERIAVVEALDVVPEPGVRLTALTFAVGKTTLVAGDSMGRVRAWMPVPPSVGAPDAPQRMTVLHELEGHRAAVVSLAPASRSRMMGIGFADGRIDLVHLTSERRLAQLELPSGEVPAALAIAPKQDGLLAWSDGGLWTWEIDPRYPEAGLAALLLPVWYEGYPRPAHVWQSSSGSDAFEPKLGLWPLIFGTLKATCYSMLLGVPIALLAALFTSEFLSPRARARVKPAVELMASLPSVVLGFMAALVIAPFVRAVLPAVLAGLVTVPVSLIAGAYAWQLLPPRLGLRLAPVRPLAMALMLPVGLLLGWLAGVPLEQLCFAGDIVVWLDGQIGSPLAGWLFLTLPAAALAVILFNGRLIDPWLRGLGTRWPRSRWAGVEALRFLLSGVAALGGALLLAGALTGVGLDPRGWYLGTYEQSNALIVGFVMGFAIIPIIYTIAEDALAAVPEHLRSASLGAGATPWQTAQRIVIPTAMSGLFSAVMVGLGRAVGETMIVLMAAGNTPIMEWNPFNGFRTLSANIAVELPEAVRNSTHYRTLFLAALTLFALTFVLNTFAEIVRQRFRRRAVEL